MTTSSYFIVSKLELILSKPNLSPKTKSTLNPNQLNLIPNFMELKINYTQLSYD